MMVPRRVPVQRSSTGWATVILTTIGLVLMFGVSPDLLALSGWPYNALRTNLIYKIHPAVYVFAMAAVSALFLPTPGQRERLAPLRSSLILFGLMSLGLVAMSFINAKTSDDVGGGETSAAIVTFLAPALALFALMSFGKDERRKFEIALRIFLVVNSLLAVAERYYGWHLIPTRAVVDHWRATALLGHPLVNATITGAFLVYLSVSEVKRWNLVRSAELGLHAIALLCFGGRAVAILAPVVILFRIIQVSIFPSMLQVKATLNRYYVGMGLAVVAAMTVAPTGFVQAFFDRFSNDRGSAETRLVALRLLGGLDIGALLFGLSGSERTLLQAVNNTQFGIENAWIALIMMRGILVTTVILITLILLTNAVRRTTNPAGGYIIFYFMAATLTSLSIGSKTLLLAQILTLVVCLCTKSVIDKPPPARTPVRPRQHRQAHVGDLGRGFDPATLP